MRRKTKDSAEFVGLESLHSSNTLPAVLPPILSTRIKEHGKRRRDQQMAAPAAAPPQNSILEEEPPPPAVVARSTKERRRRNQIPSSSSPPVAAETPCLEEAEVTKKQRRKKEHAQSSFCPYQTHRVTAPPVRKREQTGAPMDSNSVKKINREIIKTSVGDLRKQKLDQGFVVLALPALPRSNCTEQNSDNSSRVAEFFDQFTYQPDRRARNPSIPRTLDHLPRLPPQGFSSLQSSQPTANETSEPSSRTTSVVSNIKHKDSSSGSASASCSQEMQQVDENAMTERNNKGKKERTHEKKMPSCPPCTSVETPIFEQEAKMMKRKKQRKEHANLPLPFDSFQTPPDHLSRLPPRGFSSFESSQLTSNDMSKASNNTASVTSKAKKKEWGSGSASCSQEKCQVYEEAMTGRNNNEDKRRMHVKPMPSSPSLDASAETPIFNQEANMMKKQKRWKDMELSGQLPLPFGPSRTYCVQPQGTTVPLDLKQEQVDAPKCNSIKKNNCKKVRGLSNRELIKKRVADLRKQQKLPVPEGFVAAISVTSSANSTEENPDHSSSFCTFFDQFAYKPDRQGRNAALPRTPDRLARLPPRCHPSFELSPLTTNEISEASNDNMAAFKKKLKSSGSQLKVNVEVKDIPEKMRPKKQGEPPPMLTTAEKRSDKYRRLPLNKLVPPARSPHKLLQEKYASDPWKVIVICMLLNLTQGKQVRTKVKGFFKRYPDPQSAFKADPIKMAEYLQPLGLQHVKTCRIQKFSKQYVEQAWTYITELCGVGKYAADAYAIFCAGRATEVVPKDHKLVDYWKYVCFELPAIQGLENVQEAGITGLDNVIPVVQEPAVCC